MAANVALGQLLINQQRPKEAVPVLEQAIKYEPNSAEAHANLFLALAQTQQFPKAIYHGRTAISLDPKSFDAHYNLGLFLVTLEHYKEGISHLREAQKLRPDDPRPLQQIQQAEAALKKPAR